MKLSRITLEDLRTLENALEHHRRQISVLQAALAKEENPPTDLLENLETCKLTYSRLATDLILIRAQRGLFIRR